MADDIIIYHNPRCSKSRATLTLLQERGIDPTVIDYQKTPPSVAELKSILQRLGLQPRELMRKKETEYAENELDRPELTDEQLIEAMHNHPRLIERPIVLANNRAAIGRPPEQVLEIL